MSVSLTSNFFLNARGFTFEDGGGITWTFNKNTNQLTGTAASLPSSGVTPGNYTYASITVTAQGIITAAANGTQPVTSIGSSNLSIGGTTAVPTVNLSSTQVTNIGLGATALQSATTADSISGAGTAASPLELVGDAASPGNSFYYGTNASGAKGWYANLAVANPSAAAGLTAVNGSTGKYMDAGSAPALSQAISPTMTGNWTFSPASGTTTVNGVAGSYVLTLKGAGASGNNHGLLLQAGTTSGDFAVVIQNASAAANLLLLTGTGALTTGGPLGVNGNTPPAQSTGWGTPTGGAAVSNFPGGGPATLAQCSAAIAQIIAVLKAAGFLGT